MTPEMAIGVQYIVVDEKCHLYFTSMTLGKNSIRFGILCTYIDIKNLIQECYTRNSPKYSLLYRIEEYSCVLSRFKNIITE
jgi:hypothetical protein